MITYELAKELKNAGFPQLVKGGSKVFYEKYYPKKVYIHLGGGHNGNEGLYAEEMFTCCLDEYNKEDSDIDINNSIFNILDEKVILIPTLLDLVEACGEEFEMLFYKFTSEDDKLWYARSWKDIVETGSSPEIAVARLFLSLNKK